jgi:hypothetical protein
MQLRRRALSFCVDHDYSVNNVRKDRDRRSGCELVRYLRAGGSRRQRREEKQRQDRARGWPCRTSRPVSTGRATILPGDTEGQIRLHAGSNDSGVAAVSRYGGRDLCDFDELRFGPRVGCSPSLSSRAAARPCAFSEQHSPHRRLEVLIHRRDIRAAVRLPQRSRRCPHPAVRPSVFCGPTAVCRGRCRSSGPSRPA